MTQTRAPGQKTGTQGITRLQLPGSVKLTGRGGVVALFAACFLSLLIAAWTGWSAFADVMFVITCGVVTCYTRVSGLRAVVVCPPLAFFAGTVLAQLITAPDTFSAADGHPGHAGQLGALAVHRHRPGRRDRARPRLAARPGRDTAAQQPAGSTEGDLADAR